MTRVAFRILTASQFLNFEFFGFHFRFDDLGFNKGSVNQRSSDGAGAAGIGEQHPVNAMLSPDSEPSAEVDGQDLSCFDAKLVAAGLNDCEHQIDLSNCWTGGGTCSKQ